MRQIIVALSWVIGACGSSPTPCQNYCTVYCDKALGCGVTINGGPPMTAAVLPVCENSCSTAIQAQGDTNATCEQNINTVDQETCAQFVANLNTNG